MEIAGIRVKSVVLVNTVSASTDWVYFEHVFDFVSLWFVQSATPQKNRCELSVWYSSSTSEWEFLNIRSNMKLSLSSSSLAIFGIKVIALKANFISVKTSVLAAHWFVLMINVCINFELYFEWKQSVVVSGRLTVRKYCSTRHLGTESTSNPLLVQFNLMTDMFARNEISPMNSGNLYFQCIFCRFRGWSRFVEIEISQIKIHPANQGNRTKRQPLSVNYGWQPRSDDSVFVMWCQMMKLLCDCQLTLFTYITHSEKHNCDVRLAPSLSLSLIIISLK